MDVMASARAEIDCGEDGRFSHRPLARSSNLMPGEGRQATFLDQPEMLYLDPRIRAGFLPVDHFHSGLAVCASVG
jgi:hypothetical protein